MCFSAAPEWDIDFPSITASLQHLNSVFSKTHKHCKSTCSSERMILISHLIWDVKHTAWDAGCLEALLHDNASIDTFRYLHTTRFGLLRCCDAIYSGDLAIPLICVEVQRQRQRWTELLISPTDLLRHTHSVTDTPKLQPPLFPLLSLVNTDRWKGWISLLSRYLLRSVAVRVYYCIGVCQGHFLALFNMNTDSVVLLTKSSSRPYTKHCISGDVKSVEIFNSEWIKTILHVRKAFV